jgi:hypothetical protein
MIKYKLLVIREEGGLDVVKLSQKHKRAFIEKFGLREIPTKREFDEWKESLKKNGERK